MTTEILPNVVVKSRHADHLSDHESSINHPDQKF